MYGSAPVCITPVVKRLLEAGAAPGDALALIGKRGGHSILLRNEDLTAVAKELIAAGAKIDLLRADWLYITPLLLKPVLNSGIDINAQDDKGNTILMHWISRNQLNTEIFKLLMQAGAKVDLRNNEGKTALQLAKEKNNDELIKLLKAFGAKE